MITNGQFEFLRKLARGDLTRDDNPKRYSQMKLAIRKQIDKNLARAVWLVDNCPEVLKDEEAEIEDEQLERYRRFKAFIYIANMLNPVTEIEQTELKNVLKKLSQLYPKYYFEVMKENFAPNIRISNKEGL